MVAADVVLLAAGRSSRMGEPKGLVRVRGRPWIEWQLDAVPEGRVIVVLGVDRDRYLREVPGLDVRALIVVNPDPDRGVFSSIQAGLGPVAGAAFILPIDVPAPGPSVWAALAAALDSRVSAVKPRLGSTGGHPVLLSPRFVARVRSLPWDERLDAQLHDSRVRIAHVPTDDPRVGMNLNEPADWGSIVSGILGLADGARSHHR